MTTFAEEADRIGREAALKNEIDLLSRESGLGSLSEAASNAFYGINHRGIGNPVPYNTDNHGLTFFTRPRMNLSYNNLSMDRRLSPLLTDVEATYQRAVRTLLDPVGGSGRAAIGGNKRAVTTPLVDQLSPFMPVLTNHLLSLSGWPDPVVNTYNAKEGIAKETWTMVDDVSRYYGSFDLQASFRNIAGDPITLLLNTWIIYAANVYKGVMMPYPDSIIENEIDYQTAIYRLILDPQRQFVQKISRTIAFPTSSALGAAFNFNSENPFSQDNAQQISVPLHCIGAEYMDPILIKEFNYLVYTFNPLMLDSERANRMTKLTKLDLVKYNYNGYPRIDPISSELEWWVPNVEYAALKSARTLP